MCFINVKTTQPILNKFGTYVAIFQVFEVNFFILAPQNF